MSQSDVLRDMLKVVHEQQLDKVWIVDKETGCMFVGDQLVHTDSCRCDDYYQEAVDIENSWESDESI